MLKYILCSLCNFIFASNHDIFYCIYILYFVINCQKKSFLVDIWSIGCIFAELVKKTVLFPGTDHIDQWTRIVTLLGTPSREFTSRLQSGVRSYVESRQIYEPMPFENLFSDLMFPPASSNPYLCRELEEFSSF